MNWTTEKATETSARGVGMRRVFCLIGLVLCLVVADSLYSVGLFMASAVAVIVLGAVAPGGPERRIKADKQYDSEGTAKVFTLSLGDETVTLDPGKPWVHVDRHKWVTRGLIEEPQSFHVLRDGTVEINGEKLRLDDREGNTKLEHEINKHHTPAVRPHVGSPVLPVTAAHPRAQSTGKVQFKVRLDHLGHMMIEYLGGAERAETSLRGLHTLVQNGLMLKPQSIHLDLLQRNVEIDGVRFECNEAGARQLEETLNSRYAPTLQAERDNA